MKTARMLDGYGAGETLRSPEIRNHADLKALEPEWTRLWERCPDATPFQSPEWLLSWWRRLGRGGLHCVAVRAEGKLVALAPCFVSRYFGLPLRRLGLLGTGNTDYLDVLIDPEYAESGAATILARLEGGPWDFADFQQLRSHSSLLETTTEPGWQSRELSQEVTPFLPLPDSVEEFQARLSSRLRGNLRYARRRLERELSVEFGQATRASLPSDLEALFRLHGARWRRRRLPGAFPSKRLRAFHTEAAARFLERGWLSLFTLRIQGVTRAALYCFTCREKCYYYSGGFDPELRRYSPGALLIAYAMEQEIRRGTREFDFLRGSEPYKYVWGARDRWNHRRLLWTRPWLNGLIPRLNACERTVEHLVKSAARRLSQGR